MEAAEAEVVEILMGLRDLVPAASPEPARRRMFPRWEHKRRRSDSNSKSKKSGTAGRRGRERLSPATPLSFCHCAGDNITAAAAATTTGILRKMSQHKQWLKEQKQWMHTLISTKVNLQKSVEEAKRRCRMLRERNCWLRSLHADAEIKLRHRAFDLNTSAAAAAAEEEAMLARQRRVQLSAQARKRRMLLQRAKSERKSNCVRGTVQEMYQHIQMEDWRWHGYNFKTLRDLLREGHNSCISNSNKFWWR